MTLGII